MHRIFEMKLRSDPFNRICTGEKIMEYRLRDEKRALLCKGDYIRFTEITKPEKTVLVEIIDIYTAPSFVALEQRLIKAGILVKESSLSIEMREYYSLEAEKKYGVVGIRIGLV